MPVKPLSASTLKNLLERIDYARQGEIRSLAPLSPTSICVRFSVQDIARGYDWIDVLFRIEGVNDAKLMSDNVLRSLDMREGITVEINDKNCALAIGSYSGRANEAPFYILGTSIGYEELPFSA
ncbi:hypothetical protein Sulku_2541 [Sulfuricurvum kujiense DSM 16994]|uniref:Uncharacterized protein n=1 Tax=Sulfuricurvum kujiense (strain ATCC BAA-921 / DSM 16994 / JCM 11577 / YK-1) TaxID=709032 RepID=E4TZH3_SULKY|nr:hypothetical protein [Sulfuricurvum kujiense]ADR35200.1 hypothetical protein Sulku_2541 [Sulfuricurvum kujiense DSM 16994]